MRLMQKLPGVGRRTAERYAFDFLLTWKEEELQQLSRLFLETKEQVVSCDQCGALSDQENCHFCSDDRRRKDVICVVASAREVFSIEATGEYRGQYHVLGALLSPLDGRGETALQMHKLTARLQSGEVKELVIALDSTLEGDTTALYLKRELERFQIPVSRLAFGIPVGSSLEYVDGGTLARAFLGRGSF